MMAAFLASSSMMRSYVSRLLCGLLARRNQSNQKKRESRVNGGASGIRTHPRGDEATRRLPLPCETNREDCLHRPRRQFGPTASACLHRLAPFLDLPAKRDWNQPWDSLVARLIRFRYLSIAPKYLSSRCGHPTMSLRGIAHGRCAVSGVQAVRVGVRGHRANRRPLDPPPRVHGVRLQMGRDRRYR